MVLRLGPQHAFLCAIALVVQAGDTRDTLRKKSVRELKNILTGLQVGYKGLVEKHEFVNRVIEARTTCHTTPTRLVAGKPHKTEIAGLRSIVLDTSENPDAICVICHGYGANAENMLQVAENLKTRMRGRSVRFIMPEAPIGLGQGSRAWWPLDVSGLITKALSSGPEKLFEGDKPAEMQDATTRLEDLIQQQRALLNLPSSKILLAGFSQGSWLAANTALKSKDLVGGLAMLSGALYEPREWPKLAAYKPTLRVFQSHGTEDNILPYRQGQLLSEMFRKSGCRHRFVEFSGGHTIPGEAILGMKRLLEEVLE